MRFMYTGLNKIIKWTGLAAMLALLSACSTKEVVVIPPEPPEPPPVVITPLITLENALPIADSKRAVGANIDFLNSSPGTYQYILFRTTAYDATGKVIKARKSLDESAYLRVAGPINPGERSAGNSWKNTWASAGVSCLDIDSVEIVFSDGSVEVAKGETLAKANTCIPQ
jgi:hypothetical protein